MNNNKSQSSEDFKIKLEYNLLVRLGVIFAFCVTTGATIYILISFNPNIANPYLIVLFIMMVITGWACLETFSSHYLVDTVGIRRQSFWGYKPIIRWDEVSYVYYTRNKGFEIIGLNGKFEISLMLTNLQHFANVVKTNVPEHKIINAYQIINELNLAYQEEKSGNASTKRKQFKRIRYSLLAILVIGMFIFVELVTKIGDIIIPLAIALGLFALFIILRCPTNKWRNE